jgi:hypothetical protein
MKVEIDVTFESGFQQGGFSYLSERIREFLESLFWISFWWGFFSVIVFFILVGIFA